MLKIIIADDHAIVRRGLKHIVLEEQDDAHVCEAADSNAVLNLLRAEPFDVVVLDITMPGRDGLELLKELKRDAPQMPVLMLSMHPEERFAVRALKAGASGYLTKESAPDELCIAIRKVLRGGKYITPSLAELLAESVVKPDQDSPASDMLSDREYQVLRLIASGKTVSQVATELMLSVNTISTYRTRILEKMNMKTNAELTRYAIERGVVD